MAVAERPREGPQVHLDYLGAALCALGLAGPVFALIRQPSVGWGSPEVAHPGRRGLGDARPLHRPRGPHAAPDAAAGPFRRRNFAFGNLETLLMYGGLSAVIFFLVLFLQQVAGYDALQAGLATLPITIVMFYAVAPRRALADRFGPRWFMGGGPLVAAAGPRAAAARRRPRRLRHRAAAGAAALLARALGHRGAADRDRAGRRRREQRGHRVGRQQRHRARRRAARRRRPRGRGRRPVRRDDRPAPGRPAASRPRPSGSSARPSSAR